MSFFGAVLDYWGKPAASKKSNVQTIRDELAELEKRRGFMQRKIDDQNEAAKKAMQRKNMREARMCAQRSMDLKKQLEIIDGSITKLDTMISAIESQATSEAVVKSMAAGTRAMKESQGKLTVSEVDDVMVQANESIEDAQKLGEAVAQPIDSQPDNSELDDYLASLDAEDQEDVAEPATTTATSSTASSKAQTLPEKEPATARTAVAEEASFPRIPRKKPNDDVDDELAKLAAEMAM